MTDPVAGVGCIGCLRERHTERERERGRERDGASLMLQQTEGEEGAVVT